jgi:hypothetical protein
LWMPAGTPGTTQRRAAHSSPAACCDHRILLQQQQQQALLGNQQSQRDGQLSSPDVSYERPFESSSRRARSPGAVSVLM